MRKMLIVLILFASAASVRAQSIIDPFFSTGHARLINPHIIAPPQNVPSLVSQAIAGMSTSTNRNVTLLAHLKEGYGYAVWDAGKTFTSQGYETALVPLVPSNGNSITGILVAVKDGNRFVYGVMDLETPFPYASAPLNTPGMPGLQHVIGLSVIFNHELFGTIDCGLVQALMAAPINNYRRQQPAIPKSCYVHAQYAGQNCWTIYTGTIENPYAHSYEDCVDVYNYMFICNTDSADDEGAGGGGGGGGNGSTSDSGMQENEGTGGAICNTIATVLELSGIYSESRPCYIQVSVSGCDFSNCNLFFEGGDLACGATLNSEFLGISFPVGVAYQIGNPICIASRTSSTYDSQARNYIICGNLYVRFELLFSVFGISDSFGIITRNISSCYRCHNC